MNQYSERIGKLREEMEQLSLDYYLITSADFHNSEYVGDYFKTREFFSGFTGSNGSLLVGKTEAFLWTDGRYFVQAERELQDSDIVLMKMGEKGVPSIAEFLKENANLHAVLGFDGRIIRASYAELIENHCADRKLQLLDVGDLSENIWLERPDMPCKSVYEHELYFAGKTVEKKREEVLKYLEKQGADYLFLSKLDDIMWYFNLRGDDIACNPVALSYAYLSKDRQILFLQKDALTSDVFAFLMKHKIEWQDYNEVFDFLERNISKRKGIAEKSEISIRIASILKDHYVEDEKNKNPIPLWKAVKNEVEIRNMKQFFLRDSVALCKFLYWIKHTEEELTEYTAAKHLDELRLKIYDCVGLSFPTISAYGANAAMMHYEATEESAAKIERKGFLLVDSGGQYKGATTDVTRTIAMGELSEEEKEYFTLVLVGVLRLQAAVFMEGCTGRNLDILAREALWQKGVDYKCGTGHGVGYCLNVHEGPHSIRYRYVEGMKETILKAGMVVTDEPGVYFEGKFGIRTENTLLVTKREENGDGVFLQFHPLTLAPVDVDAIKPELMNRRELEILNAYHEKVYKKISPFLEENEKEWLAKVTAPIIS